MRKLIIDSIAARIVSRYPNSPLFFEPRRDNLFADIMGRLFELGFNLGLLATITQREDLASHFGALYEQELSKLYLDNVSLAKGWISQSRLPGSI